jgi:hypothetical protein
MSGGKRTKKDVEEAYRRGFQDGFNVRPNPMSMILRSIWRKHELKKLKNAWERKMKESGGIAAASFGFNSTQPIGIVKNFREDEHGLSAEIELKGPDNV